MEKEEETTIGYVIYAIANAPLRNLADLQHKAAAMIWLHDTILAAEKSAAESQKARPDATDRGGVQAVK